MSNPRGRDLKVLLERDRSERRSERFCLREGLNDERPVVVAVTNEWTLLP